MVYLPNGMSESLVLTFSHFTASSPGTVMSASRKGNGKGDSFDSISEKETGVNFSALSLDVRRFNFIAKKAGIRYKSDAIGSIHKKIKIIVQI